MNLKPTPENQAKIREFVWRKCPENDCNKKAVFNLERMQAYQEVMAALGTIDAINYLIDDIEGDWFANW